MELLLVRHAIAHEPDPSRWSDDSMRPLTDKGRDRFSEIATNLRRLASPPSAILSSPYTRTLQTSAILAERTGWHPILQEPALAAGSSPELILRALAERGDADVCLVGHEPDLGILAATLLDARLGSMSLKKGGAALLEVRSPSQGGASLRWLATPAMLRG